jgi:DNA-binding NtrC family response regulator
MRTATDLSNAAPVASSVGRLGYHDAVSDFKRRLIEVTLRQAQGNRTHAARALGLQRTYLLRLIRELGVAAPPPPPRGRHAGPRPG